MKRLTKMMIASIILFFITGLIACFVTLTISPLISIKNIVVSDLICYSPLFVLSIVAIIVMWNKIWKFNGSIFAQIIKKLCVLLINIIFAWGGYWIGIISYMTIAMSGL